MPVPSPTAPQLDLFEHSQDTMLCNDVLDALLRRDAVAAGQAHAALAALAPQHEALAPLGTLIAALVAAADTAPFSGTGEAARAGEQLERDVAPAARAQFGAASAARWLAPLWCRLAERAVALPFRAAQPDDHAVPLWLRSGDPAAARAAAQAVAGIESWWRQPVPLGWMAQARHATDGLDAVWPLLAELAWLAPARLDAVARACDDSLLGRLLRRFDDDFDPGPPSGPDALAWFPAWLLIDQPALLPRLREARRGADGEPERCFRLLVELLGLERQGRHRELIDGRRRLRDRQPALYAAYMKSR